MTDDVQNFTELLLRIEASTALDGSKELPEIPGWNRESSTVDPERGLEVRYAVYSKILQQPVTGEGLSIDIAADKCSELELALEALVSTVIDYEKRVYLISHPIAVWSTTSEVRL